MRTDLPTGTVTFCFTDVEGSTALLRSLGPEAYGDALADHRETVRKAFRRHGGVEVDTQGDAFFFVFDDAERALAASEEAQAALAAGPVRVRIGLHTGTPRVTSEGYVGEAMHLGARIGASGHGGQVLLSAATRALVDGEVIPLGSHRLKDFPEPIEIFQLGRDQFPPLKTIANTNLPSPASSFIGRERETREVTAILSDSVRLLTLTGPGGSGKTRLAIEAASELLSHFNDGVFWVGLATLRDPALVLEAIGETLGAKGRLSDHIGQRELLLVIDNLEHVVEAAGDLVALLEECPNLKLMVTSRERLRVRGEVEYAVPPMSDAEGVALFCERSRLEPDGAIEVLCRCLDNLPLALELAAARTSVLSPEQIQERLFKRLDLLKGGRDADSRQQTLRATIEWSHDLLTQEEQGLFARLSVFAGGCTVESAEEIVDADLDVLQSLVDKSLLRHSGVRFWMLETIRQYASERLEILSEPDKFHRRHAEHFLALAHQAEPAILGVTPQHWLDRLETEHDNLRAALDWFEAAGETQDALACAGAIWEFWCLRGHYVEGWRRLEHLLEIDASPTQARAKALIGTTHLASNADVDPAYEEARAEQALALNREIGDTWGVAYSLQQLAAVIMFERDEYRRAQAMLEESDQTLRELGDEHHALQALYRLADCRLHLEGTTASQAVYKELLERAEAAGDGQMEARALGEFALLASDEARHREALELIQRAYRIDIEMGDPNEIVMDIVRAARVSAYAGKLEEATELIAAAEVLRSQGGFAFFPRVVGAREEVEARASEGLDGEVFAAAWERGRLLTRDDVAKTIDRVIDLVDET